MGEWVGIRHRLSGDLGEPCPQTRHEEIPVGDCSIVHRNPDCCLACIGQQCNEHGCSDGRRQWHHFFNLRARQIHRHRWARHIGRRDIACLCGLRQEFLGQEATYFPQLIRVLQGWLGTHLPDRLPKVVHELVDVGEVGGQVESRNAHGILCVRGRATCTNRHVEVKLIDRRAKLLVVVLQAERNCGQESVIHGMALRLHTIAKITEAHVERREVVVDASSAHHWRQW